MFCEVCGGDFCEIGVDDDDVYVDVFIEWMKLFDFGCIYLVCVGFYGGFLVRGLRVVLFSGCGLG